MPLIYAALWLWSLPTEFVGLVLLPFYGATRAEWQDGVAWVYVRRIAGYSNTVGQTWGRLIYLRDDWARAALPENLARIKKHESDHRRFCDILGPLWMLAYLTACVVAMLAGGNGYADNIFERHARDVEVEP